MLLSQKDSPPLPSVAVASNTLSEFLNLFVCLFFHHPTRIESHTGAGTMLVLFMDI